MQWPHHVLHLIVKYQQNPLRAARALAYAQVAAHEGWHTADRLGNACAEIAAHRAASLLLEHLYPHEIPGQFEARFALLATHAKMQPPGGVPSQAMAREAQAIGLEVANTLTARSLRDGAGRVWSPRQRPADFPGAWQPAFPLYAANPAEGMASEWRPWVTPDPGRHVPPPAPRPGSARHREETREVLATARALTQGQREAAHAWHLDAGSVTPGGLWMLRTLMLLAQAESARDGRDAASDTDPVAVRSLAVTCAVAMAMHDAFIACWRIKMRDWSERPVTAVRRDLDPDFAPLLVTPGFPAYVSGHATVSAAACEVLCANFPQAREALQAAAEEAAMSRLWGGLHFSVDNEEGLRLGRDVGQEVLRAKGWPRGDPDIRHTAPGP